MRLEQRKSPRLETRVGNKGLIAISKPPFLRVVMILKILHRPVTFSLFTSLMYERRYGIWTLKECIKTTL